MSRYQLDARRLLCPMPVIRTQDRIADLREGDILEVQATDPGAIPDISSWCRINGHTVLEAGERDGEVTVIVQVGAS